MNSVPHHAIRWIGLALCAYGSSTMAAGEAEHVHLEKIKVTGYHLERTDYEGPAPVLVIHRPEILETGFITLAQLAHHLTFNYASLDGSRVFGIAAASGFDLRGLGTDSTLVLVNGRRVAAYGEAPITAPFVDLNSIPLAAVERVEVLKDGASAIYGADALAGVVNVVLRSSYSGASLGLNYRNSVDTDAAERRASFIAGREFGTGRVTAILSWFDRNALFLRDRDFSADGDQRPRGGLNFRSAFGSPPSFLRYDTGEIVPDPTCPQSAPLRSIEPLPPFGSVCRFNINPFINFFPESERLGVMLFGNHRFADGTFGFFELQYADIEASSVVSPAPLDFTPLDTVLGFPLVPASHPGNPFGSPGEILYRGVDIGNRVNVTDSDHWRAVMGLAGYFSGWEWEIAGLWSENEVTTRNRNHVLIADFQAALLGMGGNRGDQFYNPFGLDPGNSTEILDWLRKTLVSETESVEATLEFTTSRDLAELPGGAAGLALGAQFRHQSFRQDADRRLNEGAVQGFGFFSDTDADQDIFAAYGELRLPFAADWEAQVAVRHEDYERFGSSTNPKLALAWRPADDWLLRGSWSSAFRPPSLPELFSDTTTQFIGAGEDPVRCPVTDDSLDCNVQVPVDTVGNPGLEPEDADTWFLGGLWTPGQFEVRVETWRFDHDDRIVRPNPRFILANLASNPGLVVRADPTADDAARGLPGRVARIRQSFLNAETVTTQGVDLEIGFRHQISGFGELALRARHSYLDKFRIRFAAGRAQPTENLAGTAGIGQAFPRWRSNYLVGWRYGDHRVTAIVRHLDDYRSNVGRIVDGERTDEAFFVDAFTTLDLQYGLEIERLGGATLRVGCNNCTDKPPPFSNTGIGGINPGLHDPRGAVVYASWSQPF